MTNKETACVHYYYGDGKGKSTAAFGLCLRASGAGKRVVVTQFLKGAPYAELESFARLGIPVHQTSSVRKFIFQMDEAERAAAKADCERVFEIAREAAASGDWDVVVLDEVTDAVACGMLEESALLSLLETRAPQTELVLTGHAPNKAVVDGADYVTEMKKQKHPYDRGLMARPGIEY